MNETFSLKQFGAIQGYKRLEKLGDKLEPINTLIDWEALRGCPKIKCHNL